MVSSPSSRTAAEEALRNKRFVRLSLILLVILFGSIFLALFLGRYSISPSQAAALLLNGNADVGSHSEVARNILFNIRLPRILLAILAGGGLAAAGAAFQAIFSNPLAAPDTLGVATGAAFGAALGILLGISPTLVQILAFAGGLAAVALVIAVTRFNRESSVLMIILAGLVVSAFFSALISLVKFAADPQDVLPSVTFWIMGSLVGATRNGILIGGPMIVAGALFLHMLRWRLNAASLPDDEAESLGIPVGKIRLLVILSATLITASAVSMCGLIGWIGLLVPHAARLLFGSDNRCVLPASILLGAIFMLLADTAARTLFETEVPVSILTAVIGAPFFIYLLNRNETIRGPQ